MWPLGEIPVAIVEKGKAPGAHLLSGAVVNHADRPTLVTVRSQERPSTFPNFCRIPVSARYFDSSGSAGIAFGTVVPGAK